MQKLILKTINNSDEYSKKALGFIYNLLFTCCTKHAKLYLELRVVRN